MLRFLDGFDLFDPIGWSALKFSCRHVLGCKCIPHWFAIFLGQIDLWYYSWEKEAKEHLDETSGTRTLFRILNSKQTMHRAN